MKYKYIVIVDDGQNTGAQFLFNDRQKVYDFVKLCFETNTERDLQIEMKLIQEEENGDISEN